MICRKCGKEIPKNAKHCPECGTPVHRPFLQEPFPDVPSDIIIRMVFAALGAWIVIDGFKYVRASLGSLVLAIGWLRSLPALIGGLIGIASTLTPGVIFVALSFCYIYTAVNWDRKKMDVTFAILLILTLATILGGFLFGFVGMLFRASRYSLVLSVIVKDTLRAFVSFLTVYLLVSWLCPRMPLADVKHKEDLQAMLDEIIIYVSERMPKKKQPEGAPRVNEPVQVIPAGPAAPPADMPYIRLHDNRGVFKYLVFGILTCGIYPLFVHHNIAKEMNICCKGDGRKTPGILMFLFLSFITCDIYVFIYWYKLQVRLRENCRRYGIDIDTSGSAVVLWMIFGFFLCFIGSLIGPHLVLASMNRVFRAFNAEQDRRQAEQNAAMMASQGGN